MHDYGKEMADMVQNLKETYLQLPAPSVFNQRFCDVITSSWVWACGHQSESIFSPDKVYS
jgi:hypothetical protein